MAIGSGLGSQIGFASETTYGTAATPTNWLEVTKAGLEIQVEHMMSEALRSGLKVQRSDRYVVNKKGVSGDIELDVTSNNLAKLLRHCLNDDRAYTTTKTGSSPYTYTYQIGDPASCPPLTFQVGVADINGTVNRMDATGCFVKEFNLSNQTDELLTMSISVDGRDMTPSASTVTSASYASGTEVLSFAGGSVSIASATVPIRSLDVKVSHGIDTERYQINSTTLKSRPIRNALTDVSGSFSLEFGADAKTWATDDLVTKMRAGTTIALVATWTGSTAISGTTYPSLSVSMPVCLVTKATPTIEGPGVNILNVDYKALDNGSNEPVTVTYVSSENVTS